MAVQQPTNSSHQRFVLDRQLPPSTKMVVEAVGPIIGEPVTKTTKKLTAINANQHSRIQPSAVMKTAKVITVDSKPVAPTREECPKTHAASVIQQRGKSFPAPLAPKFAGVSKTSHIAKTLPLGPSKHINVPTTPSKLHYHKSPTKANHGHPARRSAHAVSAPKRPVQKVQKMIQPEHPLYAAFKDASAAYITDTTTRLPAQLSTTIETLSTALTNASLNSQNLLLASAKADKALLAPLSDEVLIVTDPTTNTKVKVTLGARMEAFTQLVNTEQKRLRALWRKWHEISTNINDTTIGDADDNIKARPAGVATDADGTSNNATASKSYAARHRQLEEEHKKKRQDILDRFEHDCNVLTKGVEDSEKKFQAQQKSQRKQFLDFMLAQMNEED